MTQIRQRNLQSNNPLQLRPYMPQKVKEEDISSKDIVKEDYNKIKKCLDKLFGLKVVKKLIIILTFIFLLWIIFLLYLFSQLAQSMNEIQRFVHEKRRL